MKDSKIKRIDFSKSRLTALADKYYHEGNFFLSLRYCYKQLETYGGDGEVFARLADIYEGMGLHASAVNCWFRYLHIATEEEYPDVFEGLAVNYLNMGNETQAAYYYNRLIDADDTISDETKMEIAAAFSKEKKSAFRFVYPPKLADYSQEVDAGSRALKAGDCKTAVRLLSVVEKGAKQYAEAREMQAVAHLLNGECDKAQAICEELLEENPDDIRTLATLAAVYLEEGKTEESKALAEKLYAMEQVDAEDLYKVATVCCENGMHEQAYEKFCQLEDKLPFDGRMMYFKAVSAFKCKKYEEAERTFDRLCTVYPDAEVSKFYLQALRLYNAGENTDEESLPTPNYFYHLPQEEREARCKTLMHIKEAPKDEAQLFGLIALHDGYFRWCFDEMDGGDHDLQYLSILTAEHVRADEFLQEVLLDSEVLDVLKVETLRLLYERNEEDEVGLVLCHIYRKIAIEKINVGRKKRKRFIEAHARVASKFVVINDGYGKRIKRTVERFYRALEENQALDLVEKADDLACAIFLSSGIKELRGDENLVAKAFDANVDKVRVLRSYFVSATGTSEMKNEGKTNEID